MKSIVVFLALATALMGCAQKAPEAPVAPPAVYNQAEYEKDLQDVLDRESQLTASGHRFSFTDDQKIFWDEKYAEDFVKVEKHKVTNQQRIHALEVFYEKTSAFLKKYNGEFNLRNAQGFSTRTRLDAGLSKSLRQKTQLAQITAAALKSSPIEPEPEYPI